MANGHYQSLIGSLDGLGFDTGLPKVIGLASSRSGAGVSTIASNLAIEVARSGLERVLLVEANLQKPKLDRLFSVNPAPGLVQALAGDLPWDDCLQQSGIEMLQLMTAGVSGRRAAPGFRAQQFARVLDKARREFDFIVFDLPPATKISMSFKVAGLLDGILLVIEAERSQVEELQRVKRQFVHANAKLLGAVMNNCRQS
jgi:capsular exopolysaccharide synthesis family protein